MTIGHGGVLKLEDYELQVFSEENKFKYLFPELLNDPENFLPESSTTVAALRKLGLSQKEIDDDGDSTIPAAFTYLGQFLDHDITLDVMSDELRDIDNAEVKPLKPDETEKNIMNQRTPVLDLDSVYKNAPRQEADNRLLLVGTVQAVGNRPPGKDDFNDLPRADGGKARIGDERNDENLVVAQLHVAFLRTHNEIIKQNPTFTFDEAKAELQRHYQWLILQDFLPRIVLPEVLENIRSYGRRFYKDSGNLFMPLEFSVAAYRFGHSMVRNTYNFNLNFPQATLELLFTFTHLSGGIDSRLVENWIIEWENFVENSKGEAEQFTRSINTRLVDFLFELKEQGNPQPGIFQLLASRNLVRGYILHLPTGQAVANLIGANVLSPAEILNQAASDDERIAVEEGNFHVKTPLWYYILAEAVHSSKGNKLGEVGSTIVAETILALVEGTPGSISEPESEWTPTLGSDQENFSLRDLLIAAGVLVN